MDVVTVIEPGAKAQSGLLRLVDGISMALVPAVHLDEPRSPPWDFVIYRLSAFLER
jgi:hypothetical protein